MYTVYDTYMTHTNCVQHSCKCLMIESFCDEQGREKQLHRLDRSRRLRSLKRKWIAPRWASELNGRFGFFSDFFGDFQSFKPVKSPMVGPIFETIDVFMALTIVPCGFEAGRDSKLGLATRASSRK